MLRNKSWGRSLLFLSVGVLACESRHDELAARDGILETSTSGGVGESGELGVDAPLEHPLTRGHSSVPWSESHDSPDGKRYVIEEGVSVVDGTVTRISGVREVEVRHTTEEERAATAAIKHVVPAAPGDAPAEQPAQQTHRLGSSLVDWLASAGDDEAHLVHIRVRESAHPGMQIAFEEAVARGLAVTENSAATLRAELLADLDERVAVAQEPVLNALNELGLAPTRVYEHIPQIDAILSRSAVLALADSSAVVRMDLEAVGVSHALVSGTQVIAGTQIKQFIDEGHDGSWGNPNIRVAVVELNTYNDEHPGFRDSGGGGFRIGGRYTCNSGSCTTIADFPDPASNQIHATNVAGILAGDLRDGQDANHPSASARIARSGYAGETRMYLYRLTQGGSSAAINAFNHMIGMVNPPRVVNISIGFTSDDPACLGESALSLATNDLYEAGILPVVAAGNAGHADKYDCTTSAPATAIGALAVGGHGNLNAEGEAEGDEADVRFAGIFADTSRGGITSEEGKARTIIDLTAFAPRSFLFDHVDGYAGEGAGTSYSSPTVAAGAVDFIDFYKVANNGSAFIDNPGAVVANLLLQGDRQYGAVRSSDFYSNLWGAGRFKMRLPSTIGMDAPYAWVSGSACVEAGEVITLPINNGNPLSADVDDFKGVIYWYDRQHQWGIPVDDIDLRLRIEHGAVLVSSLSGAEEKERVYHSNVGGLELWLEIEGYVITADSEGCGQNSMLVYYAYFWEDDDRDDADGPGLEIDAE